MRRGLILLLAVIMALSVFSVSPAEERTGIAAKVMTRKGPLKLRSSANAKGRVLGEIPNGTCILVEQEEEEWCRVSWQETTGYCKTEFLVLYREADLSILDYRVLKKGDKGEDVLALKRRLQELGYIRDGSELTSVYNDVAMERVALFQRQTGMTEDGIASQELQAYLFSEKAPVCGQQLPRVRSRVIQEGGTRVICGCCMGEGCECCHYTGWLQ